MSEYDVDTLPIGYCHAHECMKTVSVVGSDKSVCIYCIGVMCGLSRRPGESRVDFEHRICDMLFYKHMRDAVGIHGVG